ncbi:hypothetical protein pb186bvf_019760 [Paramecium bursaria]
MYCETHQNQLVTNICISQNCMHPLCPDCVITHINDHKQDKMQVVSIVVAKQKCQRKIELARDLIEQQMITSQSHLNEISFQEFVETQKKYIRDRLITYIDETLSNVTDKLEFNKLNNQKIVEDQKSVLQELDGLLKSLRQSNDHIVENIIRVCQLDLKGLSDSLQKKLDIELGQVRHLNIDDQYVNDFISSINKLIKFDVCAPFVHRDKVAEPMIENLQMSPIKNVNNTDYYTPQKVFSPIANYHRQDIEINVANYFSNKCKQQILPFFKSDDTILYTYNFKGNLDKYQLKNDFLIPKYHQSIITQHGDIYLLGGVDSNNKRNSNIYYYEPVNCKLVRCGQLILPRSSFGIVYLHPHIYSITGLVPQMTTNCERYNTMTNKSEQIQDCLFPSASPTVLCFNNQIIKISNQQIELWDQKIWIQLQIKDKLTFFANSAGSQINAQQFIIFGGYDERDQQMDQTFLCTLDNHEVNCQNIQTLPYREGFWNPQTFIKDKKLYVLHRSKQKTNIMFI